MFHLRPKKTSKAPLTSWKETLPRHVMDRLGRVLLDSVLHELRKELAEQGNRSTPAGMPEGLPVSPRFLSSFKYELDMSKGLIQIVSTWPWIDQIVEGRPPYPLEWLTQEAGVPVVPMKDRTGRVLFRTTPEFREDAWEHPGWKKHTFVSKGVERALPKLQQVMTTWAIKALQGHDLVR